jgi:hypothetical protein
MNKVNCTKKFSINVFVKENDILSERYCLNIDPNSTLTNIISILNTHNLQLNSNYKIFTYNI